MKINLPPFWILLSILSLLNLDSAFALKAPATYEDFAAVHFAYSNYSETEMMPESDPDQDGLSNDREFLFGTDPTNPDHENAQTNFTLSGGNISVSGYGRLGRKYTLQSTENLNTSWADVSEFPGRDQNEFHFEPQGSAAKKFFRTKVEVIPPLYVDIDSTTPDPDGRSWATAFPDLQDAINAAEVGQEIWVAEGTYHPTEIDPYSAAEGSSDPRNRSFFLKEGIVIAGGFAGSENSISERPGNLTTILSGDFNQNDVWTENGNRTQEEKEKFFENAYHVLMAFDLRVPTLLMSLEITGGFAMEFSEVGGNLTVTPGSHSTGGGLLVMGSNIQLANCKFSRNICTASGGGAISASGQDSYNSESYSATLTFVEGFGDSEFVQNHVASYAETGVVWALGGAVLLSDNTFADFRGVLFYENTAPNGGAVAFQYVQPDDLPPPSAVFVNCGFWNNKALAGPEISDSDYPWPLNGLGGAIFSQSGPDINLVSCYFGFNQALTNGYFGPNAEKAGWGGAIALSDSSASVSLSIFDQNFADDGSGAIFIGDWEESPSATLDINFCSFYSNIAPWGSAIGVENVSVFGKGNIFLDNQNLEGLFQDFDFYRGFYLTTGNFNISQSLFSGNNSAAGNSGQDNQSISPGYALFTNPSLPEGEDGVWNTDDDGFTLTLAERAIERKIVTRPLPLDLADFDEDGDLEEELPGDSFGNPFGDDPFFYGAYPEFF